ncbi:cupin domain-containing protein [Nocardia otitidiscaviarum]|uniref:cupin domain-containing protein n=1 Tax=Nocardia otitidiscaviarum TaxID=1823 RepID=UPI0007C85885|nr:cupin domain-containing protein [Nocardia otitidiscaviarum]MBF6134309.1 cupin domain-containing protein [Nocardia otitidiscaviarum]MBF6484028.1 cupin domain-containing protein [Nocardia otitidiscaviarum]
MNSRDTDAGDKALLVRHADAETLDTMGVRLYADHDMTGGKLSANRAFLPAGADGPPPHYHSTSAELFYMLNGRLRVLAGDQIHEIGAGDFLLIPPNMTHAWAAPATSSADVLVVFTPGIERFDYFRLGDRIRKGMADPVEILETQERFDNHFVDSPIWRQASRDDDRGLLDTEAHRSDFLASEVFRNRSASAGPVTGQG